jgi:RND family efflux transporter MFP subunit
MIDRKAGGLMRKFSIAILMVMVLGGVAFAQGEEKKQEEGRQPAGPPPALVVVSVIEEGEVQPMAEFVGTVYYPQVSKVAPEVQGKVVSVKFEEGRRVKAGQPLVVLDSELLEATVASTEASYEQVLVELEKAKKDLARIENLYRAESVSESVYDEHFFRVRGLEQRAQSLEAQLEGLYIELQKKTVNAPFSGVVLEKLVEKGEWVAPGAAVATMASDGEVDVMVDVPEQVLGYLKKGGKVAVKSGGSEFDGVIRALIAKGDVATRTFPVKIRAKNPSGILKEGMEARTMLPSSAKIRGLLVNRDAVIKQMGMDVVFVILEGKAKMVPVGITGYHEDMAGIAGPGLQAGMQAVVKGNERLRPDQPVTIMPAGQKPAAK